MMYKLSINDFLDEVFLGEEIININGPNEIYVERWKISNDFLYFYSGNLLVNSINIDPLIVGNPLNNLLLKHLKEFFIDKLFIDWHNDVTLRILDVNITFYMNLPKIEFYCRDRYDPKTKIHTIGVYFEEQFIILDNEFNIEDFL